MTRNSDEFELSFCTRGDVVEEINVIYIGGSQYARIVEREKKADKTQLYVLHNMEQRVRQWIVKRKQDTGNARAEKLHMRGYGLSEERRKWMRVYE